MFYVFILFISWTSDCGRDKITRLDSGETRLNVALTDPER